MLFLRTVLFYVLFTIISLIFSITGVFLLPLHNKYTIAYSRGWIRSFYWLLRITTGTGYKLVGMENLPKGPFIMACKHQSMLETFIFPITFDHPHVIMKKELTQIPLWGKILTKYDVIAIDRKKPKEAIKTIVEKAQHALTHDRPLVIFPEGTRYNPGEQSTYQSGVAILYDMLKVPVVPIAVNTGLFWPKDSFIKHPGTGTLKFLPPIEPGLSKQEFLSKLQAVMDSESLKLLEQKSC